MAQYYSYHPVNRRLLHPLHDIRSIHRHLVCKETPGEELPYIHYGSYHTVHAAYASLKIIAVR